MGYHDLSDSGMTPEARREEADRLVKIITESGRSVWVYSLSAKEQNFVDEMDMGGPVSTKQLFWLRDIKDKL